MREVVIAEAVRTPIGRRNGKLKDVHPVVLGALVLKEIVVTAHRSLYRRQGKAWSRPAAYRWLRYEDPAPVERLAEGVRKLRERGAKFDAEAVDKACARAPKAGDLS